MLQTFRIDVETQIKHYLKAVKFKSCTHQDVYHSLIGLDK